MLLNLVKPILSARTMNKVSISTDSVHHLMPTLLELLPEDELPPCLGGTNYKLEDEMLNKFKAFADRRRATLAEMDALVAAKEATIRAGSKLTLEVRLKAVGTKIKYSISVDKHDVDFRIFTPSKEIVPKKRISSDVAESGEAECDKAGAMYVIVIDNSHSKYRSKQVKYDIQLIDQHQRI